MAVKSYKYNDKTQLTKHFNVSEWKCKCGKNHEIKIDDKLPVLLENLLVRLEAEHGNIYSGYRCPEYDKKVGGRGTGSHTLGYSVDIRFVDSKNKIIPSSKIALALEDMNHQYGIGYRAGGAQDYQGNTHIDTRPRKWYGDESISNTLAIWDIKKGVYSFYDYLGIKKEIPQIITPVSRDEAKEQVEVLIGDLNVRDKANGSVLGVVPKGIYNVMSEVTTNGYLWVQIDENAWFATREGDWTRRYKASVVTPEVTAPEDEVVNDDANNEDNIVKPSDNQIEEKTDGVTKVTFWQRIVNFFRNLFN